MEKKNISKKQIIKEINQANQGIKKLETYKQRMLRLLAEAEDKIGSGRNKKAAKKTAKKAAKKR